MSGAFSRRGAIALAGIGAASLAAAGFLGVFGDALYDPPSAGADSFSRSAVGHHAFVELLRSLGFRVLVSRHATASKASDGAPVVLLEPRAADPDEAPARLADIAGAADTLLVVLPKRLALPDPVRPGRAWRTELVPIEQAQRVLDALELDGKVVRPDRSIGEWKGDLPAPSVDRPQLVVSDRLEPLVGSDAGMLAGELDDDDRHVVVVADPDVLETHGLGRGENAVLAARLVERLGAGDLPLVLDETLHGLEQQPSIARELLRFPLLLATLSALATLALLAWAALVRFGRPCAPEPALASGKTFLVDSGASLLRHRGHAGHAAQAYLRAAKDEVVRRLRPSGEGAGPDAWLARAALARGKDGVLREIEERVRRLAGRRVGAEEEAVRTARRVHRWREEMTDGDHRDPRRDRAAPG